MSYYAKVGDDGYLDADTPLALEPADGLTEITNVSDPISIQFFTRYWSKYRYIDNGQVQAPGNLPDLTIDALRQVIAQQATTVSQQAKQLDQLNTLLPQVQTMVVQSTQAQAKSDATVTQLQTLGMQLTQQLALIQSALPSTTAETTGTTDTTKEAN